MMGALLLISVTTWIQLLAGSKANELHESPTVLIPEYAVDEERPQNLAGVVGLALALARELSNETALERAHSTKSHCECKTPGQINILNTQSSPCLKSDQEIYLEVTEQKFRGINRCC